MEALYKSETGKVEILNLYNQKLMELNINYQYQDIETIYGKTNVIFTGDTSKPPILIVHGSNSCVPIAIETYRDLETNCKSNTWRF